MAVNECRRKKCGLFGWWMKVCERKTWCAFATAEAVRYCQRRISSRAVARNGFSTIITWNRAFASLVHILSTSSSRSAMSRQVFEILCEIELSLQSRAHFDVLIIYKKCNKPVRFVRFLCEIKLLLQSRAHFVDLIFKKCNKPVRSYRFLCEFELLLPCCARFFELIFKRCNKPVRSFPIFMRIRALATVSRTFFRTHLQKVQ